ncbi:alpha-glucosidase family protein [Aliiglaciecola sp. CAU 1673]|uniref:alpha-glucosidase family protein n=1 Tax=Aliiglaciecola sp. CAU 1673 TaxID=3032595 RepID=UPI0023D98DD1|nr:alpha-glucosidase family protein [Aliiglaciecola sp. CAU 1673]MDF2179022.1 alpha-glucosidase family protein [Aliiglaciecola sp. CAU 1673]
MKKDQWWRGAAIYQIYPRSFLDTNADGIGDLPGIIERLDYVASLGVDAIWISPFFRSPMKDFGYDISDYRDIDPMFGNLDDFERLVEKAGASGLKIMIDQVLSHTSDQHPWFLQSRESRNNAKADWYVWADAKPDGSPPNNWLSIFGGSAWQWEPRRGQYYLHNFLTSQPDLNFHNRQVQQAALDNVEFWLEKGVHGLRLDAINFCFHDKLLRDNPAKPVSERKGRGFSEDNPYAFQYHYYNNTQPENLPFIESLRALMDRYPGTTSLGEVSSEDSIATLAEYTNGEQRLHMGYSFELLSKEFSANYIKQTVEASEKGMPDGWPCWAISNHDVTRAVSRWGDDSYSPDFAKMLLAMVASLRGSVCFYQGEELGLPEAEVDFEHLQDPYGIAFWPNFKGRDGCRTPFPWQSDAVNGGFSTHKPWLPMPSQHLSYALDKQEHQADSVLNSFRRFMAWRKTQSALVKGSIQFIDAPEPVLAFVRESGDQRLLVCINLEKDKVAFETALTKGATALSEHGLASGTHSGNTIQLPGYGYQVLSLNP